MGEQVEADPMRATVEDFYAVAQRARDATHYREQLAAADKRIAELERLVEALGGEHRVTYDRKRHHLRAEVVFDVGAIRSMRDPDGMVLHRIAELAREFRPAIRKFTAKEPPQP